MYGIGRELPFTMSAWSDKMNLDFPLLSDASLSVAQVCVVATYVAPRGPILTCRNRSTKLRSENSETEQCCSETNFARFEWRRLWL